MSTSSRTAIACPPAPTRETLAEWKFAAAARRDPARGERLRQARIAKRWTAEQLADASGITFGTERATGDVIAHIESGAHGIPPSWIEKIAAACGVTAVWIMEGDPVAASPDADILAAAAELSAHVAVEERECAPFWRAEDDDPAYAEHEKRSQAWDAELHRLWDRLGQNPVTAAGRRVRAQALLDSRSDMESLQDRFSPSTVAIFIDALRHTASEPDTVSVASVETAR